MSTWPRISDDELGGARNERSLPCACSVRALRKAQRLLEQDAALIERGGGSAYDLVDFDDERTAEVYPGHVRLRTAGSSLPRERDQRDPLNERLARSDPRTSLAARRQPLVELRAHRFGLGRGLPHPHRHALARLAGLHEGTSRARDEGT